MVDLEQIQKMWERDAKIDIDNLHTESSKFPLFIPNIMKFTITYICLEKSRTAEKEYKT